MLHYAMRPAAAIHYGKKCLIQLFKTHKAQNCNKKTFNKSYEQEKFQLDLGNVTLAARWVGLGLIVLTWIKVIPLTLGWVGFGIAALSFILEAIYKKNVASPKIDGNPEELPGPNNKDKNDS